jgi:hypothetical protein
MKTIILIIIYLIILTGSIALIKEGKQQVHKTEQIIVNYHGVLMTSGVEMSGTEELGYWILFVSTLLFIVILLLFTKIL